jgi:hypothetical protein
MGITETQFNAEQQGRTRELIEKLPWGDVDSALCGMEEALRLAMEATRDDFRYWEMHVEEAGFVDEFSLTPEEVAELSPEWRLAYVARLLRSLAMAYGVSTDYARNEAGLVGENNEYGPAELLRGLNDISWMPVRERTIKRPWHTVPHDVVEGVGTRWRAGWSRLVSGVSCAHARPIRRRPRE